MGRRLSKTFRPSLDPLEDRRVMSASASNPIVHTAIVPIAVPIGTYNNTFTQINDAFYDYEGPYDDVLNAIGSAASAVASTVVSTALSTNNSSAQIDTSNDGPVVQDSKGDPNALEGRLESAIEKLPGGQAEADSLINRTFQYGGLSPSDAPYFQSKLDAMVKHYVTQQVHRGNFVLIWPGETPPRRSA
jgi:hypothetical protein